MRKFRIAVALTVGAAIAGLAGCAPKRQPAPPPPTKSPVELPAERPLPTSAYLLKVASIDLYQIRSGELALQRSASAGNRGYAQRMIDAHRGLSAQLSMAGRRLNLLPPNTLQPEHQQWLDQLAATTSAAQFDATYRRQQMVAHDVSYRAHAAYAYGGDSPTLRQVARYSAGVEEEHGRDMRMM
jgi:putative membrane protein